MIEWLRRFNRSELAVLGALVLLVFVTPMGGESTHPLVLGAYRTLLLAIVSCHLLLTDRSGTRKLKPWFLAVVMVLTTLMLISVLRWNGSSYEGFYAFYKNVLFLAAFIVLAQTSSQRSPAAGHAILGSVVVINLGYFAYAYLQGEHPLRATFVNQNYLGSFALPGLAVCAAAVLLGSSARIRIAAALAGIILYLGIGQTSSRGAMMAALVLLGVAGFRAARRFDISWLKVAAVGALLLIVTVALSPALVHKFMDRGVNDPYNYQRGKIWLGTLGMIMDYPATGVGLGHYYYMSKLYTPAVETTIARYGKWPNIAHSEYLQYFAEIGVPAALLLFGIAAYLFSTGWRRARHVVPERALVQESAILAAVGLATHALVDNNWTVPVVAAGLAVISQADFLPLDEHATPAARTVTWRNALALVLVFVWGSAALIPAIGLYFNEAGHSAFERNDFQKAERNHRFALAFIPEHPVLLDNLGLVYFDEFMKTRKLEYLDRAEILFSESMDQNPHYDVPAKHLEIALIQRLTADAKKDAPVHRQIITTDQRLIQANPFNTFNRKNLAEAFYNVGERTRAVQELEKAIELEPNYVAAYLRLADWYAEEGRSEESARYRQRAVQVVNAYRDQPTLDPFEDLLLGRPQRTTEQ